MGDAEPRWVEVDDHVIERLIPPDPSRDDVPAGNTIAGLPEIEVSPPQGKFLHLLARMVNAKRILEVGSLGGYSTIWLARALPPEGTLISLEIDPHYAQVAREHVDAAGCGHQVDIRIGPAMRTLAALLVEGHSFDLVFIDADKKSNATYAEMALAMSHPGTVIVVDNVVRDGAILDVTGDDPNVVGTRALFDLAHDDPRIDATVLQTVGLKGWDGLFVGVVQ